MGSVQKVLLVLGFPQLLHSWMLLLLLPWVSPNTHCEGVERVLPLPARVLPLPAGDPCGAASSHHRCLNFHEPAATGVQPWH